MKIHFLGLFSEFLDPYFSQSLIGKAREKGLVTLYFHQLRDWSQNKHKTVDDKPYGGGAGMVMLPDVVCAAVRDLKAQYSIQKVILPSPSGALFSCKKAQDWSKQDSLLFLCGRYEGVDKRAIDLVVDEEVSIGNYVISGGELAAAVMVEACTRYLPGLVQKMESVQNDSFENGLLEHPHYTRPEVFEGLSVPAVLVNGDHKKIDEWRREESLKCTQKNRPDLLK